MSKKYSLHQSKRNSNYHENILPSLQPDSPNPIDSETERETNHKISPYQKEKFKRLLQQEPKHSRHHRDSASWQLITKKNTRSATFIQSCIQELNNSSIYYINEKQQQHTELTPRERLEPMYESMSIFQDKDYEGIPAGKNSFDSAADGDKPNEPAFHRNSLHLPQWGDLTKKEKNFAFVSQKFVPPGYRRKKVTTKFQACLSKISRIVKLIKSFVLKNTAQLSMALQEKEGFNLKENQELQLEKLKQRAF